MSGIILASYEGVSRGAAQAALRIGGTVVASIVLGAGCLWALFGHLPEPAVYFEYLLHMPGRRDPEFYGMVWIFFATLLAAIAAVVAPQSKHELRLSATIAATTLATLLYYMSRSASQNIENLLPFIVLLAVRISWLQRASEPWRAASAVFFGAILAIVVIPNWESASGFRLDYNAARLFTDEKLTESRVIAGLDRSRFGVVPIFKGGSPPLIALPRWGLIDSWGEWMPLPASRLQLYVERSLSKMPDRRPAACFIAYKPYAWLVQGYTSRFDIVSARSKGEYLLYGLVRKDASLPKGVDPCRTNS